MPALAHPVLPRPLRVLRLFWTTSLAGEMEYRLNFVLAAANSLVSLCGALFGLYLLFRVGGSVGGWTWEQALLVAGIFTVLEGLSSAVFGPNLNRIVDHVRRGTLDFVLLKPMDSQFWVSMRNVSIWGLPNMAFGLLVMGGAAWRLGVGPAAVGSAALPFLLGGVILYGMWFLLAATSIWFVKVHNATYVLRSCLEAGRYPVSAFPRAYRFVFTFVLPVAFLTTVPAEAVLGRAHGSDMALAAGFAVLLFVAARRFWLFSLRFYTSASS